MLGIGITNIHVCAIINAFEQKKVDNSTPISRFLDNTHTIKYNLFYIIPCSFLRKQSLRSLYADRLDPGQSYMSSLIRVHPVKFVKNVTQIFAADDYLRRHFSDAFFLGALWVNP